MMKTITAKRLEALRVVLLNALDSEDDDVDEAVAQELYEEVLQTAVEFDLVNEHRLAHDRAPFTSLSPDELAEHLALVDQYAPFGQDPWGAHVLHDESSAGA